MKRLHASLKRLNPETILVLVISVVVIAICFFILSDPTHMDNLNLEIVKILIQLLLIVIFGGILIQQYNRGRDRAEALNEFRKTLLDNLIRAYFKTKKARRILDANISNNRRISYTVYEAQMKEIIDAQLEFEFQYYRLDAFPQTFSDKRAAELKEQARKLEKYLNGLIDEYKGLKTSENAVDISELPKLCTFITKETFRENVSQYFHSSFRLIQREILRTGRSKMVKLITETIDGKKYRYYPLGKHVVRAPGVCGGRPTFKYTRIEITETLERLAAGIDIDELMIGYQRKDSREAISEAARLVTKQFVKTLPPLEEDYIVKTTEVASSASARG